MIIKIILLISQIPRWQDYEKILKYALDKGYTVTSLVDWYLPCVFG